MESDHDLISLFEHDLFGKPVSTFPDHALDLRRHLMVRRRAGAVSGHRDAGVPAFPRGAMPIASGNAQPTSIDARSASGVPPKIVEPARWS
jgi:hypothetical protein